MPPGESAINACEMHYNDCANVKRGLPIHLSADSLPAQVLQHQHKMEEMQVEFAQMLRETLDKMHERLSCGTFHKG